MTSGGARLPHVDALRGLAALMVLYQHLLEYVGSAAPAQHWAHRHFAWTLDYLTLGKVGVVVFFAISGFIVPFSFAGATPRLGFVLSRFFRLYPAYWLSLLVAVWLLPVLGVRTFSAPQVLANFTMLPSLWHQPDVLGVYWTLTIEFLFYALCFALFCWNKLYSINALTTSFLVLLGFCIGSAAIRGIHPIRIPVALPLYLAIMIFASCTRLALIERDITARRCWVWMFGALLLVAPLVWAMAYDDQSHKESVLADALAIDAALVLFVFTVTQRAWSSPMMSYFGAISYSIYLFHPIALEIGRFAARQFEWPLGAVVLTTTALVLTLTSSHIVYRTLERPSIRFGKQLLQWGAQRYIKNYQLRSA